MTAIIRLALPQDIEEIIRLCVEHAEYEKASYSAEGKAEKLAQYLFGEHPRLYCFVAQRADEIVGYTTVMQEFSTWDAAYYLNMDCLYVRSHARSRGIGELLMQQVVQLAQVLGLEQIQWHTPDWNERAIAFYQRIGASSKAKCRLYLAPAEFIQTNINTQP
ncbi:MAG: GNAT family N-acetyltransferase [Candidatus Kapabacteria bacterium]|jgi:ribosomal protein S18 acetylase RimI-like enzyme|nr:GNAT family N-acetyltransferase [Candidatus Kapabacteria bacterium]